MSGSGRARNPQRLYAEPSDGAVAGMR
jgi:hypothetical protein